MVLLILYSEISKINTHNQATTLVNVRDFRREIQKNWQHRVRNTQRRRQTKQKNNTLCVGHHNMQANTTNVDKTRAILQTTGGEEETNIIFMRKS